MSVYYRKRVILFMMALILASCNLPVEGRTARQGSPTPDLVQTLTAMAPTLENTPANSTVEPTRQAGNAASTSIPNVGTTPNPPASTSNAPVTRCNWAQFLGDVTVPDGTVLQTGEGFVKKWRLKNIGTCTWDQDYRLVFSSGSAMSGPTDVSLPKVVVPGDTVDALVNLKAPSTPGSYTGYWKLATSAGAQFGVGSDAQGAIYVQIKDVSPATQVPGMTRVNFFANSTEADVAGSLDIGQTKSYVLRILKGQTMMARVTSPSQNALLRIYGLDTGQVLLENSMGAGQSSWQGHLPSTQDYVIQVINRSDSSTNFTLGIVIPENIVIPFQPGSISTSLSYPIHAHETHTFLWRVAAGQTMNLKLTPDDKSVLLAFYGYDDGQPYLRIESGQTSWSGKVPTTQDYIIQVVSVVDTNTNFTLDVSVNTY